MTIDPVDTALRTLATAVSDDAIFMCVKFAYARGHADLAAEMLLLMQTPATMDDVRTLSCIDRVDVS